MVYYEINNIFSDADGGKTGVVYAIETVGKANTRVRN